MTQVFTGQRCFDIGHGLIQLFVQIRQIFFSEISQGIGEIGCCETGEFQHFRINDIKRIGCRMIVQIRPLTEHAAGNPDGGIAVYGVVGAARIRGNTVIGQGYIRTGQRRCFTSGLFHAVHRQFVDQ